MKVVQPDELLRSAAEVLDGVHDHVVVVGAAAVHVALYGRDSVISPTRDIDVGMMVDVVDRVVSHLKQQGFEPSDVPHEARFTWVRDSLKLQLMTPFHPFPKGPAAGLPTNNQISELGRHREPIAFTQEPNTVRLYVANTAALVGLKEEAFGRTRADGRRVDRDFSDAVLLFDQLLDEIGQQVSGHTQLRKRVLRAAERLRDDEEAMQAAVRELVSSGECASQREAMMKTKRAAERTIRRLHPSGSTQV